MDGKYIEIKKYVKYSRNGWKIYRIKKNNSNF